MLAVKFSVSCTAKHDLGPRKISLLTENSNTGFLVSGGKCVMAALAFWGWSHTASADRPCVSAEDLAECPSLCRQRCQEDADFRRRNGERCVDSVSGKAHDQGRCTSASDVDEIDVDKMLEEDGFPSCTPNIPALEAKYVAINQDLNQSLEVYKPILEGNYDKTESKNALCAYSFDEIKNAYRLSTQNKDALGRLKAQIEGANDCAEQVNRWQSDLVVSRPGRNPGESEKPSAMGRIPMEKLRSSVIEETKASTKKLAEAREHLSATTAEIEKAVPTLKFLVTLHHRTCPASPSTPPDPHRRPPK